MKISAEPTHDNRSILLDMLRDAPGRLKALAEGRKEDTLLQPLGQGQRSFQEMMVHLLNSESRLAEAVYQILLLEEPDPQWIHPERDWGKLVRYQKLSLDDLLVYFKLRRLILLGVLEDPHPGSA